MPATQQQLADILNDVDLVVEDANKFKIKLRIGEDAYATLRKKQTLKTLLSVKGAGAIGGVAAASPVVATTFFGGGGGFLSFLGIGAAAVTPIGWVVAAAVGSGAAYYGVMQLFSKHTSSRVDIIPKFINTPIDLLGATIFDMMAGLGLKVAYFSEEIDDYERGAIVNYFADEWGISRDYTTKALPLIENQIKKMKLKDMAASLAEYQLDNPDCNPTAMKGDIMQFLNEIAHADGNFDEREEAAIEIVERQLDAQFSTYNQIWRTASKTTGNISNMASGLFRKKDS